MLDPETRTSLIASLADPAANEAWAEFHRIYRPLILRTARARGLQHADAEDLVQEVMTIVGRAVEQFDPNRSGSFRGWLFTITRNCVVNFITRARGPIGSGDTDILNLLHKRPAPDDPTASQFDLEYLRLRFQQVAADIRSHFEEHTWQSFWLTAVEQHSIADVARQLGKSTGAVRMARSRVMAQFRHAVGESP
ncbi:MAG: sigma-70 family RNA polymerase sigma factor [Planctomycetaceae bacterium]|nr:sigma-70 family RNA polymerase sigma factor [Planctomycetaceae bacterium]